MHPQRLLATLTLALPLVTASYSSTLGCYSAVNSVSSFDSYTFQSHGYCIEKCAQDGYQYGVLADGIKCGCTDQEPATSDKVSYSHCNISCAGWPADNCGGESAYTVLTVDGTARDSDSSSSDDTTESASTSPAASTAAGGIVVAATTATTPFGSTGVSTTTGSMATKASTSGLASKAVGSSSATTVVTTSASPSPTANAAGVLRAGPVAGALVVGLGLLL